jgi:hypothetical protein
MRLLKNDFLGSAGGEGEGMGCFFYGIVGLLGRILKLLMFWGWLLIVGFWKLLLENGLWFSCEGSGML